MQTYRPHQRDAHAAVSWLVQRLGAEVSVSVWKYNRAHPRQPCVTMRAEALQVDRRKDEVIRHCDASPRVDAT